MSDEDRARALKGLIRSDGWIIYAEWLNAEIASAADLALGERVGSDRERADAALVYRALAKVQEWPYKRVEDFENTRRGGVGVDELD